MTGAASSSVRAGPLLDFWFGAPGSPEHDRSRDIWFKTNPAFDQELRDRFLADHEAAAAGRLDDYC